MNRSLSFHLAVVCVALAITTTSGLNGSRATAATQSDREQFVGAWRLGWMEAPGPDGMSLELRIVSER